MKIKFLILVEIFYLALAFMFPQKIMQALFFASEILKKILPILIFVLLLMTVINIFFKPKNVKKILGKGVGFQKWLIAIGAGIFSFGPMYLWYPMLKSLKEKGASNSFLAAFLYNRSIKPTLLPLMAAYFDLKYVLILTFLMIVVSIMQGLIFELIKSKS
jgi:uncharacterized membrane protein YraQ (UPF0718 family)